MHRLRILPALSLVLLLAACGGSGGGSGAGSSEPPVSVTISGVGWYFENVPSDYSGSADVSLGLNITVSYTGSASLENVQEIEFLSPLGTHWVIPTERTRVGTNSNGVPYLGARLVFSQNQHMFPLAGLWTAKLRLKNGSTASYQLKLHEPGTTSDAIHAYLFTEEDWSPPANASDYVPALRRFPAEGYTVRYAGGALTTSGLAAVRAEYFPAEPNAYNVLLWMYDDAGAYLGRSLPEFSSADHSPSGWITAQGEVSLPSSSTLSSEGGGTIDLSKVRHVRFVYYDGAQFVPSSYSKYDCRSVSQLVSVE